MNSKKLFKYLKMFDDDLRMAMDSKLLSASDFLVNTVSSGCSSTRTITSTTIVMRMTLLLKTRKTN